MLEVGPFPRRPLRLRVRPADVFIRGIPEIDGIEWLRNNGVKTTGVLLPTPLDPRVEMQHAADGLAIDLCAVFGDEELQVEVTSNEAPVFWTRVRFECLTRVDDGSIKEQLMHVSTMALNHLLATAVSEIATDVIPGTGPAQADGAIISATHSAGMIGVPAHMLFTHDISIHDAGNSAETLAGNRVWVHDGSDIFATSDVFYDFVEPNWTWNEIDRNRVVYVADLYVTVAIGDFAGFVDLA